MASYFTSSPTLAGIAAVLVTLSASRAAASDIRVLTIDIDGAPHCETAPGCSMMGMTCDSPPGTMCIDLALPGMVTRVPSCVAPALVRYCCAAATDCPILGGVTGRCIAPTPGDASFGFGLCAYTSVDPCLGAFGATDAEIIQMCFRTTAGDGTGPYGTVPFGVGDCDGDGMANDVDVCLCDPDNVCVSTDAGVPVDPDGGTGDVDAGAPIDAGPQEMPVDAGPSDFDANLPPGTGLDFRGAGGCTCEAASTHHSAGGTMAALLVLGGLLRARRRSRGRSTRLSA